MRSQFDELAKLYEDMADWPFRAQLEIPSVLGLLGALDGLEVFDLGCGSGIYCRLLRQRGARRVVGFDVSEGMLAYARGRELVEPLGIEYLGGAVPEAYGGSFDVVVGVYVLPYAWTFAELVGLCEQAAAMLRPGGRFLTLPIHPAARLERDYYQRYGLRLYADVPAADGSPVHLDLCRPPYEQTVLACYWSADTLQRALSEAGFAEISWPAHRVTEEGISQHGTEFWRPYLKAPHAAILDCRLS